MSLINSVNRVYTCMLIDELHRMQHQRYAGISYNGILYLDIIRHLERPTVSDIATTLGIAKSSVSQRISDLEQQGLVNKVKDAHDGRVTRISITIDVREQLEAFDSSMLEGIRRIEQQFSQEDIDTGIAMLDLFAQSLDQSKRSDNGCK